MPPSEAERPTLWIVAGPNGSGKSTLYTGVPIEEFDQSVWIINPDALSARIFASEGLSANESNLQAVIRIEGWLRASISAYQTVGVETVLSTSKYRPLVALALQKGFEICLIYVVLDHVTKNVERVRLRVARGGHDVPADKIVARYKRSLRQLPWFLNAAHRAWIFDNSAASPQLIAAKQNDEVTVYPAAFPTIRSVLARRRSIRRRQRSRSRE